MRKLLLILALVLSVALASAQSGFQENRYYAQQYSISNVCGPVYTTVIGYDAWGRPWYADWQDCRRAEWHSYQGSYTGYFWMWNGYNYSWQARTEWRTWWYYTWHNYTVRLR